MANYHNQTMPTSNNTIGTVRPQHRYRLSESYDRSIVGKREKMIRMGNPHMQSGIVDQIYLWLKRRRLCVMAYAPLALCTLAPYAAHLFLGPIETSTTTNIEGRSTAPTNTSIEISSQLSLTTARPSTSQAIGHCPRHHLQPCRFPRRHGTSLR
jgi:hypothetical protein